MTVLYLALTVVYLALTVLYLALTVLYLAVAVLYTRQRVGRTGREHSVTTSPAPTSTLNDACQRERDQGYTPSLASKNGT